MFRNRSLARFASLAAISLLLVLAAPVQIGGWFSYVIVNGNSMEPVYHKGDLIALLDAPPYRIGDIVTYRHPEIGPVIHRIIGVQQDAFVLKGDNNSWDDSFTPQAKDIIGRAWLRIPSAGKHLALLKKPVVTAAIFALAGGVLLVSFFVSPEKQRLQKANRRWKLLMKRTRLFSPYHDGFAISLSVILCVALTYCVFSFSRPISIAVPYEIPYEHQGAFIYTAEAPPDVYDAPAAKTGEPVFLALSCKVNFLFGYQFVTDQPAQLATQYKFTATVYDSNGWSREIPLAPEASSPAGRFSTSGMLDVCAARRLVEQLEATTGLHRSQYQVKIALSAVISGTIDGHPFVNEFSPELHFWLDNFQLQLDEALSNETRQSIQPVLAGSLSTERIEPNTMQVLGKEIQVRTVRWLSSLGLLASGLGLVLMLLPVGLMSPDQPVATIATRYGDRLVAVSTPPPPDGLCVLELTTFVDFCRCADGFACPIWVHKEGNIATYGIQDGTVIYRFREAELDQSNSAALESGNGPAA